MNYILITGGAGFIATHLIEELVKNTENFIVSIDNLSMCDEKNVSKFYNNSNFAFHKIELTNQQDLAQVFKQYYFSRVYHLAANSDISRSFTNPSIDYNNTFITTWNVLEQLRINNIKQFIFASTSAIFGEVGDNIIDESFGPILPISHYGAGKLASEAFISSFAYNYDIESLIVRFPNVIGEYSTHGVIYDFINKLKINPSELVVLGNGKQEKSYLYVKDLINAIQYAWNSKTDKVDIFNIGGIDTINVSEIAHIVVENIGQGSLISYTGGDRGWKGDVPKFSYDIKKILASKWTPKLNSREAVDLTVKSLIKEIW
jgi:UDP-glucose 4-epimerase